MDQRWNEAAKTVISVPKAGRGECLHSIKLDPRLDDRAVGPNVRPAQVDTVQGRDVACAHKRNGSGSCENDFVAPHNVVLVSLSQ